MPGTYPWGPSGVTGASVRGALWRPVVRLGVGSDDADAAVGLHVGRPHGGKVGDPLLAQLAPELLPRDELFQMLSMSTAVAHEREPAGLDEPLEGGDVEPQPVEGVRPAHDHGDEQHAVGVER